MERTKTIHVVICHHGNSLGEEQWIDLVLIVTRPGNDDVAQGLSLLVSHRSELMDCGANTGSHNSYVLLNRSHHREG